MKVLDNNSNLDEIIFENRNKAYGAYSLRKNYKRTLIAALCITIGFLSMSVGTPYVLTYISPEVIVTPTDNGPHVFTGMKLPKEEQAKPLEIQKPKLPEGPVLSRKDFAPEPTDIKTDEVPDITQPDVTPIDTNDYSRDGDIDFKEKEVPKEFEEMETEVKKPTDIAYVEEPPEFVGGDDAMKKFISDNAKYTDEARSLDLSGRVYIEFVVTKDGDITDVKVLKSVDPLLDEIAINAVKKMPRWNPGKISGVPIPVRMNIPIKFHLAR